MCALVLNHLHVLDVSVCPDLRLIHSFCGEPAGLPFPSLAFLSLWWWYHSLTGGFSSRFWGASSWKHGITFVMICCPREKVSCFFAWDWDFFPFRELWKRLYWGLQNVSPDSAETTSPWNLLGLKESLRPAQPSFSLLCPSSDSQSWSVPPPWDHLKVRGGWVGGCSMSRLMEGPFWSFEDRGLVW